MTRILKIAAREYAAIAKTKTFIVTVFFAPLIIGSLIFFSKWIFRGETGPRPPMKVTVTDLSNSLADQVETAFENYNESNPQRQIQVQLLEPGRQDINDITEQQKTRLRQKKLDVFVVLDADLLEGPGKLRLYTSNTEAANLDAVWTIENSLKRVVREQRYQLQDLDPELLAKLRQVPSEQIEVGSTDSQQRVQSQAQRMARMMVPFFFMYLMFMGILVMGQHILSSIIEEKSSRIIEVLLSAVSPLQLMAGKILGLAGVGVTVVSLWAVIAYAAARWQGLDIGITPQLMLCFPLYFILGFLLFSSILAGMGSVCNTIKETQSLMTPVTLIFMVPLMSWFKLVQSPGGTFARTLSFIPPLTPMVMVLRISATSDISIAEIIATILLLVVTVLAAIWFAAKIFRIGILMYGKRPALRQILRWMKQS